MNLKPIKSLVLVERIIEEQKTAAGIILPDQVRKISQYGIVMDIGSEVTAVNIGDKIFFGQYAGTNIDDVQVIMKEEDILGFVKKNDYEKV